MGAVVDFLKGTIDWRRTAENQLNGGRTATAAYQRTYVNPVLSALVATTMLAACGGLLIGVFGGNLKKGMGQRGGDNRDGGRRDFRNNGPRFQNKRF